MDSGFERFMDSQSTGLRFLWAVIGLLVSQGWSAIEHEARLEEPHQRLMRGPTPAKDSIFINTSSIPLTALGANLYRRHYFLACLSLNALLAEVVTVTLAAVPYSSATSYRGFTTSVYLSQAILGVMLLSLFWVLFRPHRTIPRSPKSTAVVMTYLQGSSLIKDFQGLVLTEQNGHIDSEWMSAMCSMQTRIDATGTSRMIIDTIPGNISTI
ncbi:uncharacterized protein Z518_06651 [Rhinocladiella mackenziei CBS 650.93]|uniref:Uncharacterized protein n=1 Tax=Rhinocladiella mackenziei CBS 650.93 TaxID=1442369 RepID=A0A0D2III3_9EURO|nr:uncharacterized protein Z518_06651 [Rhinocladiella mackenziei CBS 650.93]KIX03101.1 hypothetical protein Z518_06651 [Rhinocladiella mackenziei CBS 650.93]